ncbi:MAG: SDR family oxidoreductase [Verrucomicrobiota bacterium]
MSDVAFEGKRAVVTGGNRGMGFGIAKALAALGAEVCLVGRDPHELEAAREAIEGEGGSCRSLSVDLATIEGARSAGEDLLSMASRWDILVNCAGNPPGPLLLETDLDYWDETFAIHCRAPFLLAQALVPAMIAGSGGEILNISSTASLQSCRGHGAYSSAKAGMNMLTRTMALEWGSRGIKANVICPTAVMTEMGKEVWGNQPVRAEWLLSKIPVGRFAEVDDVVRLVLFLVGPDNTFINGAVIPCDGGLLVGLVDGPPEER